MHSLLEYETVIQFFYIFISRTGRGRKSSISEEERSKADALPAAAAASLAAVGSDRVGVPSGVKQRRRSSLRTELQQVIIASGIIPLYFNLSMSERLSDDLTLFFL